MAMRRRGARRFSHLGSDRPGQILDPPSHVPGPISRLMREQQRRVMVNGIDQPVVPIGLALRQVFRPAPSTGIDDELPLRGDLRSATTIRS